MQRHLDLNLGIWADPIYFGDYPASVKAALGSLLPSFTPEQSAQLVGSNTYFGERRMISKASIVHLCLGWETSAACGHQSAKQPDAGLPPHSLFFSG